MVIRDRVGRQVLDSAERTRDDVVGKIARVSRSQSGRGLCSIKRKPPDARSYGEWGIEAELVKGLPIDAVKKDAVGAANNSFGVTKNIPGKTNSRCKIVLIGTICVNAKLGRKN